MCTFYQGTAFNGQIESQNKKLWVDMYRKGLFDGVPTVFIAESLARALVRTQTVVEATWAAAKKQSPPDWLYGRNRTTTSWLNLIAGELSEDGTQQLFNGG